MTKKQALQLFEQRKVCTVWDDEQEKWYFSIVDVCEVLTDSKDPTAYWRKLKQRLKEEGNETVTNCHAFKLRAADGKMRLTDVADTEQLFRGTHPPRYRHRRTYWQPRKTECQHIGSRCGVSGRGRCGQRHGLSSSMSALWW